MYQFYGLFHALLEIYSLVLEEFSNCILSLIVSIMNDHCIVLLAQLYAETGNEEMTREYCDKAVAINSFYKETADYLLASCCR